jgi:hypothetical protein
MQANAMRDLTLSLSRLLKPCSHFIFSLYILTLYSHFIFSLYIENGHKAPIRQKKKKENREQTDNKITLAKNKHLPKNRSL